MMNNTEKKEKKKEWGDRSKYGCLIDIYSSYDEMIKGEFGDESEQAKK